jgi:nitrate reductase gamma subunit
MSPLRDRPTSDLIVIFLAGMIGVAVLLGVLGLVALKIAQPDENIDSSVKVIGDILTVALGAVVGFVGGRAVGVNEGRNGRPGGEG